MWVVVYWRSDGFGVVGGLVWVNKSRAIFHSQSVPASGWCISMKNVLHVHCFVQYKCFLPGLFIEMFSPWQKGKKGKRAKGQKLNFRYRAQACRMVDHLNFVQGREVQTDAAYAVYIWLLLIRFRQSRILCWQHINNLPNRPRSSGAQVPWKEAVTYRHCTWWHEHHGSCAEKNTCWTLNVATTASQRYRQNLSMCAPNTLTISTNIKAHCIVCWEKSDYWKSCCDSNLICHFSTYQDDLILVIDVLP